MRINAREANQTRDLPGKEEIMPAHVFELDGLRILECAADGKPVHTGQDAIDLIGDARSHQADLVAIPVERLADDFFRLRTGIAGEVIQKFVTYGVRLAVLGDISKHLNESSALRDFVREANEGSHCMFIRNWEEFRHSTNR
jgi:hypothetical protein